AGNGNSIERHAFKEVEKILFAAERNALRADRLSRQRMIGIEQRLRRRVADHVDAGLAVLEQIADLRIRAFAVALARQLALDPGGLRMRFGKAPARERELARPLPFAVRRQIGRLQRYAGSCLHLHGKALQAESSGLALS